MTILGIIFTILLYIDDWRNPESYEREYGKKENYTGWNGNWFIIPVFILMDIFLWLVGWKLG